MVIYETIASRKPFWGDTMQDVLTSVLEKEPTPLARYAHDLPEDSNGLFLGLAKRERSPVSDCNELLVDLREFKKEN